MSPAIRKSNELLSAHGRCWADVIGPPPPAEMPRSTGWSCISLWIPAERLAIYFLDTYWSKKAKRTIVVFWWLCWHRRETSSPSCSSPPLGCRAIAFDQFSRHPERSRPKGGVVEGPILSMH